ncbi:hypothetical protein B296_00026074 [Ensete ventricosum]|uniref:Uncharacterized protein n=1 Tax=Ensete ventricosum TaxID=4639 RepID=A0A426ZSM8_ENSVE|nr:hypothetical protein B296_00026074 [Ensete ventricosum]
MLLLRFPNSDIRAKAARRGDQPRPSPMQGRLPTVRPQPRGQPAATKVSPQGRPATFARGDACGKKCHPRAQPLVAQHAQKWVGYRTPARGYSWRPALSSAGAAPSVVGATTTTVA